jgi:hypothetical protein
MTRSENKAIVVPIFFLDVQCSVFQQGDKNMLATATIQDAPFLHTYAIYFHILVFLPPFVLFLIVLSYQYFLFYSSVRYLKVVAEIVKWPCNTTF